MSSPKLNTQDSVKHSRPIPISTAYSRRRSGSLSSSDSSGSPTSPPQPETPLSNSSPPRMVPANLSPSSSPILSYFMSQSPSKANTFPFNRKFGGPQPVFEEEEAVEEIPVAVHARRASTAGRFGQQQPPPAMPETQQERGTGLLRRLSLSNAFARPVNTGGTERVPSPPRPTTPPNTAVCSGNGNSKMANAQGARVRRSATLNVDSSGKTRRAPSPMGERILKGHFDGFN